MNEIFISHSTVDKNYVTILKEFLVESGVPSDYIFCSSLPGNDVNSVIPTEIKAALNSSKVNIIFLSENYYNSHYCLNEEGIIWYIDSQPIIIKLPPFSHNNMRGFIDSNFKLYDMQKLDDITKIYDLILEKLRLTPLSFTQIYTNAEKTVNKFNQCISPNSLSDDKNMVTNYKKNNFDSEFIDKVIFTDDSKILFYYILTTESRKFSLHAFNSWLNINEIFNVNINNAIDILFINQYITTKDDFNYETDADIYTKSLRFKDSILPQFKKIVMEHHSNRAEVLLSKLNEKLDNSILLLIIYLKEESRNILLAGWQTTEEIKLIRNWELKEGLTDNLSLTYIKARDFFIENKFVFVSDVTIYDNPKEYTLYPSIQNLIFNNLGKPQLLLLKKVKEKNLKTDDSLLNISAEDLPF